MIIQLEMVKRLMECFPSSIINHNGEFIAYRRGEAYFNLSTCADETDIKCKVLEWLSRAAYKTAPFDSDRENEKMWAFIQRGINKYLGTNFTADDFDEIYTYLGNRCNHAKTLRFIESGYDLSVLAEPLKEERTPSYSTVKSAFEPGDTIWVLNEDSVFTPVKIKEIKEKAFVTEIGDILYEDHGWLWRCFKPKEQ